MFPATRLFTNLCKRRINLSQIRKSGNKQTTAAKASGPLSPLRKYVFSTYVEFIKNYEYQLEKRFPSAFKVYIVFKIGIQDLYRDVKIFIDVRKKLNVNNRNLSCLTKKELDLYFQMPKDMIRVAPVLLISVLPFTNYFVFPLAYLFPRQLLSSHFWTIQQKTQFAVIDQKSRLKYYKPVFRCLQAKVSLVKTHLIYDSWRRCIALLGSGLHPNIRKIASCEPLFGTDEVYHLENLSSHHIRCLLKMHKMHSGWRRIQRLTERARMIHLMDLAIIEEGGVSCLTNDEIRAACFLRGLNPTNTNREETVVWLTQWLELSSKICGDSWSFILHLPILTAYNHPSNWVLLH